MKLDPVFLLAPKPKPPSIPTRRAFLLMGGAFIGGTALGGACGYSMGVAKGDGEKQAKESAKEPGEITWEPSGDAELEELRRLAVKAPIDELFDKASMFLTLQLKNYKSDPILWRGVERMSREILDNRDRRVDQMTIGVVIENIRYLESPAELGLRELMPDLQARRSEARRRR